MTPKHIFVYCASDLARNFGHVFPVSSVSKYLFKVTILTAGPCFSCLYG